MTIYQSEYAALRKAQPYPSEAGAVTAVRASFTVPANIEAGDIIELLALPPGCRIVDAIFDTDDLDTDSTATIKWDIGLITGDFGSKAGSRSCGAELFDGITTSQTGGVARATLPSAFRQGISGSLRGIGAVLNTEAATGAQGTIGLTLLYTAG